MRLIRVLPACLSTAMALCAVAPPAQSATATLTAPVIREPFTPLPCPSKPRTTLQLTGCAEHRVLAVDRMIDALNAKVFARLNPPGRRTFAKASADWVSYRNGACVAQASVYRGGSLQPVVYASCLASIDRSHVGELKRMLTALSPAS